MSESGNGKKKRGRPRLDSGSKKQSTLAWRPSAESRQALEAAAKKSGRTLSQEMEDRMLRTVREDARIGSELATTLDALAAVANLIQTRMGAKMNEDSEVFLAVKYAWDEILNSGRPKASEDQIRRLKELESLRPGPPPSTPSSSPLVQALMADTKFSGGLLGTLSPSPEDVKNFEQEWSDYNDESVKWRSESEKYIDALQEEIDRIEEIKSNALDDARRVSENTRKK